MKKAVCIIYAMILLSTLSCKKSTEGNKNVIVKDSVENNLPNEASSSEQTDRYVAEDGSSALVTFKNTNGKKSIIILSNKKTITAPMTDKEGVYEEYDFKILSRNDSIIINQGDNVIQLKKARVN